MEDDYDFLHRVFHGPSSCDLLGLLDLLEAYVEEEDLYGDHDYGEVEVVQEGMVVSPSSMVAAQVLVMSPSTVMQTKKL